MQLGDGKPVLMACYNPAPTAAAGRREARRGTCFPGLRRASVRVTLCAHAAVHCTGSRGWAATQQVTPAQPAIQWFAASGWCWRRAGLEALFSRGALSGCSPELAVQLPAGAGRGGTRCPGCADKPVMLRLLKTQSVGVIVEVRRLKLLKPFRCQRPCLPVDILLKRSDKRRMELHGHAYPGHVSQAASLPREGLAWSLKDHAITECWQCLGMARGICLGRVHMPAQQSPAKSYWCVPKLLVHKGMRVGASPMEWMHAL